ncbi:hemagglutinin repeat-containing protein [uncultured Phascolarctobacterium sp.]|uniref:hemagglutinin repeat-containing protein n=1 Tax=uncultured Phascolarctobacterium sp. TaxID=512296 RepID=UPI0025F53A73|nr:hemagglutinin repeat-containing protein [uncultured Phascolarctobacterium sp.]
MIRITRGGNLIIVTNGDIDNSGVISAANIYNQNGGLAYGSLLNAAGSLTSGLLSGGGFGFTIGKEKQRDEYANQNSEQIGSTVSSVTVGGSKAKGEVDANSTAYNESSVTANKDLSFTSGSDTNIQGGKLSGEKVSGSVGGDLNIASKQDRNNYTEKNTSGGFGLEINLDSSAKISGSGVTSSVGTSNIDSQYSSVTEQSGIYAGEEGFDIYVGSNTDLKGGVIASEAEAEKNKISTGTLTWENIHNKAEYEAGGIGANVNIDNGADYNEKGVTPNIGMPAADEAESTTKAAIAEGTIEIRDKEQQKQDVSQLNRDTQNSLNKLGEIFNKKSIEERQELIGLFGEIAYNQIHDMKDLTAVQKTLLHGLVGGIMSKLAGKDMLTGISAAAINKMLIEEIRKAAQDDPAAMQWISAALGTIVDKAVSGSGEVGGAIASSATKNNDLDQELATEFGHIPKTETEVMEGGEQNLDSEYADTFDDFAQAIFGNTIDTTKDKALQEMVSKNFPDYIMIESYPGSSKTFKIYYNSGGKMVSSVLKEVPLISGGSLFIKLSNDFIDNQDIKWEKEVGKFAISNASGKLMESVIAGPTGIVIGVVAGGVVEVTVDKIWDRISVFSKGGVPLD